MIFQTTSLQTDESRSQEAPWRLNSKWGEWTHLWSCFSKYRRCYVYSVFKLRQCYPYYEVCQSKQRNGFIFEITEHQFKANKLKVKPSCTLSPSIHGVSELPLQWIDGYLNPVYGSLENASRAGDIHPLEARATRFRRGSRHQDPLWLTTIPVRRDGGNSHPLQ